MLTSKSTSVHKIPQSDLFVFIDLVRLRDHRKYTKSSKWSIFFDQLKRGKNNYLPTRKF